MHRSVVAEEGRGAVLPENDPCRTCPAKLQVRIDQKIGEQFCLIVECKVLEALKRGDIGKTLSEFDAIGKESDCGVSKIVKEIRRYLAAVAPSPEEQELLRKKRFADGDYQYHHGHDEPPQALLDFGRRIQRERTLRRLKGEKEERKE
ncbi:hypothetical protein HZC21_03270 [Candidatus Peregrinibacteria bacterium]|nr:hypothetical protein [Candidatus Peregrinibacteria bacterium]